MLNFHFCGKIERAKELLKILVILSMLSRNACFSTIALIFSIADDLHILISLQTFLTSSSRYYCTRSALISQLRPNSREVLIYMTI